MLIWALVREGYKGAPGTRYDKERQQSADNSKNKEGYTLSCIVLSHLAAFASSTLHAVACLLTWSAAVTEAAYFSDSWSTTDILQLAVAVLSTV